MAAHKPNAREVALRYIRGYLTAHGASKRAEIFKAAPKGLRSAISPWLAAFTEDGLLQRRVVGNHTQPLYEYALPGQLLGTPRIFNAQATLDAFQAAARAHLGIEESYADQLSRLARSPQSAQNAHRASEELEAA